MWGDDFFWTSKNCFHVAEGRNEILVFNIRQDRNCTFLFELFWSVCYPVFSGQLENRLVNALSVLIGFCFCHFGFRQLLACLQGIVQSTLKQQAFTQWSNVLVLSLKENVGIRNRVDVNSWWDRWVFVSWWRRQNYFCVISTLSHNAYLLYCFLCLAVF